jgi:outer membrane lipoprotein SlyB
MTKFNAAQLAFLEKLIEFKGDDPEEGFDVLGSVEGSVGGNVWGNVDGDVKGSVLGGVRGYVHGGVKEWKE